MARLDELVAPEADWELAEACDINNRGQIVGVGFRRDRPGSGMRGLLLTPVGRR